MVLHHTTPRARRLVGAAVCALHFPPEAGLPSHLLEEVARSLGEGSSEPQWVDAESPEVRLTSADGSWEIQLKEFSVSLKTYEYQGLDAIAEQLRRMIDSFAADIAALNLNDVFLEYFSAASMEQQRLEDLLTEAVSALVPNLGTFAQELTGTWDRGHYRLSYGVQPVEEKPFFLSTARVSALQVRGQELVEALSDLENEGLRLLAWPITDTALETFQVDPFVPESFENLSHSLGWGEHDAVWPHDPAEEARETNEERIELLLRKYGNKSFSAEDEARLEALTEKVSRLIPRVTEKDWQYLEEVSSRLDAIEEHTRSVWKKYGLSE